MNYRSEKRSDIKEETQNDESAIFTGYLPPLYVFCWWTNMNCIILDSSFFFLFYYYYYIFCNIHVVLVQFHFSYIFVVLDIIFFSSVGYYFVFIILPEDQIWVVMYSYFILLLRKVTLYTQG